MDKEKAYLKLFGDLEMEAAFCSFLVVIKARKDTPALDAETLFFLEDRKLLGMVRV